MPTVMLTLSEELLRDLETQAEAAGRAPEDFASERFALVLQLPQKRFAPNTVWVENRPVYVPPATPPDWLRKLQPEGEGSVAEIVGKWPGDETDDEIAQALARLS